MGMMPLLGTGLPLRSIAATNPAIANPCNVTDRSLVIVYLNGANDIFNTNVPLDRYSEYYNHRPNLALPENQLITLDASLPSDQQIGLHPVMTAFKNLYDEGKLTVVQGTGYQSQSRSHFTGLKNWLQGNGGPQKYNTGWLGRFLNDRYPSYAGLPFLNEPDPLAMLFGRMNDTGFHSTAEHLFEMTMSGKDANDFYSVISTLTGEPIANVPSTDHGNMLQFLENVASSLNVYAGRVQQVFSAGANSANVTYPDSDLANQLKTVSKMLSGGSRTKVFMVSKGGFDNHATLVDPTDVLGGKHPGLLSDTFNSIKAFQDDLMEQGLEDNVMTLVFSEFGRKIIQNGSYGCDHGTLNSMFLIGKGVEPGVVGTNINITDLVKGAPNNIHLQNSSQQVYTTVMQDWLGANDDSIDNNIFYNASSPYTAQKLNLINGANAVPSNCYFTPEVITACACMQVRVYLEGFYDGTLGEMKTDLANAASFPSSQPYNTAPFNYAGAEQFTTIPANAVDWLLMELRDAGDLSHVIERQAVLLRKDGFVMQPDGTPGVNFAAVPTGDYHLAVFHRNHLAVLSADVIELDNVNFIMDFTQSGIAALGEDQLKPINGIYALLAGDISANHIIDNADHNYYQLNQGTGVGYEVGDLNGDEKVDAMDYDLWFENRFKLGKM